MILKMHSVVKYFFLLIVLSQSFIEGIILDEVVDSVDCGLKGLDSFLGIDNQKPCNTKSDVGQERRSDGFQTNVQPDFGRQNQVIWNLGERPTSPKPQSWGVWNFEQPSGSGQYERTQNGNGFEIDQQSGYGFHNTNTEKTKEAVITNVPAVQSNQEGSSTQATKTRPKLGPDNGRRIISARSNCPAGFRADARGRCREIL